MSNDSDGPVMKWTTSFLYNEGIIPPPVIESLQPQDNAIDVPVETNFEITFDKDVTAVAGKYIYIYESGIGVTSTIEATNAQVSVNNALITINPTNELLGGKDYYIIIENGAFTDNSGNDFAGVITPMEWDFTTKQNDPPSTPLNLTATAISGSEIELTWDAVDLAESYKVISCDENITYIESTEETSIQINSLTESTSYDFAVKAVNDVGSSEASTCASATTFCNHTWGEAVVYTNSTVAYGIVTIEDVPASENDMVGVFVNEECRGVEEVTINDGIAYVVINIQGEADGEIFNFKIWDASECSELNVNYTITSNPGGNIGYPPDYLPINAANCNDSNSPVADFSYITDKLTTSFTNNSRNAETYSWDFGDGKTSTDENPVHVYESANNYEVKLTASNSLCGSNEITQTINITTSIFSLNDEGFIKLSPNPTNGIIFLETENIKSNQVLIEIININGQTVYKEIFTSQFLKEQIDLSEQPSGIYFVKIKADTFTKTMKLLKE